MERCHWILCPGVLRIQAAGIKAEHTLIWNSSQQCEHSRPGEANEAKHLLGACIDMSGAAANRSPEEGADTAIWLATLPNDGPTRGFFRDRRRIEW